MMATNPITQFFYQIVCRLVAFVYFDMWEKNAHLC